MANKPYVDQVKVKGTVYDIHAFNGSPAVEGYGGNDLSEEFADAAALHAAVAAGDFSKIHIGDFWPLTLSGSYTDFARYVVPSGTTYYSEEALTTEVAATSSELVGTYESATAVKITISSVAYYVSISDCTEGVAQSLSNAVHKLEVAAINPYLKHGDTELTSQHILFCSRDCMPNTVMYRKANAVWTDTDALNPWLGSALYKTLNDVDAPYLIPSGTTYYSNNTLATSAGTTSAPHTGTKYSATAVTFKIGATAYYVAIGDCTADYTGHGLAKLLLASELGEYVFKGPNGKGMRAMLPRQLSNTSSPNNWDWSDRGILFLPTEREVYGAPAWGNAGGYEAGNLYNQWPIFAGSSRHIMKGSGDGGSRCYWWLETAYSSGTFASVNTYGSANSNYASAANRVPLCFLLT